MLGKALKEQNTFSSSLLFHNFDGAQGEAMVGSSMTGLVSKDGTAALETEGRVVQIIPLECQEKVHTKPGLAGLNADEGCSCFGNVSIGL